MEDAMTSSEVFRRPTGRDARRTEPLPIAKIGLTPRQTRAAENIGHSASAQGGPDEGDVQAAEAARSPWPM